MFSTTTSAAPLASQDDGSTVNRLALVLAEIFTIVFLGYISAKTGFISGNTKKESP